MGSGGSSAAVLRSAGLAGWLVAMLAWLWWMPTCRRRKDSSKKEGEDEGREEEGRKKGRKDWESSIHLSIRRPHNYYRRDKDLGTAASVGGGR